jgi:dihydrofolate reductase
MTVLVTRQPIQAFGIVDSYPPGMMIASSVETSIALAERLEDDRTFAVNDERQFDRKVFICGGGEVYREALSLVDRIYLTVVERDFEGDTYFKFGSLATSHDDVSLPPSGWKLTSVEPGEGELSHRFEIWDRVK